MDTACDTGRLARQLAAQGHHVRGFDNSAEMLVVARRNVSGAEFATVGMDQLPIEEGKVDLSPTRWH